MKVIEEVGAEFGALTGREYAHFKTHEIEDAEVVLVAIGSAAGNVKTVVDQLRAQGRKVGMMKVRTFRPFPYLQIAEALSGAKVIGVMDRADSFGAQGGPLYLEIRSAMLEAEARPQIFNFIYGLGGRDIFPNDIEGAVETLERAASLVKGRSMDLKEIEHEAYATDHDSSNGCSGASDDDPGLPAGRRGL